MSSSPLSRSRPGHGAHFPGGPDRQLTSSEQSRLGAHRWNPGETPAGYPSATAHAERTKPDSSPPTLYPSNSVNSLLGVNAGTHNEPNPITPGIEGKAPANRVAAFLDLFGVWTEADLEGFNGGVADFDRIDPEEEAP